MDMKDMEGKTTKELLGIDKPDEWVTEQWGICSKVLEEDSDLYSILLNKFLMDSGQLQFLIVSKLNNMEEGLSRGTKLFYTIGYVAGKLDQEKIGVLEKLWGKEE